MNETKPVLDDASVKMGLLMESAQAHQKLAEGQIERLRAHAQDLDGVVRDEIRRTLVEELQMLNEETTRAARVLRYARHGGFREAVWSVLVASVCTLVPIGIARWALPSDTEISVLRTRRDELNANLRGLEQQGARIDWRHCGEDRRLCVRIDRKAPVYGEKADYFVVASN